MWRKSKKDAVRKIAKLLSEGKVLPKLYAEGVVNEASFQTDSTLLKTSLIGLLPLLEPVDYNLPSAVLQNLPTYHGHPDSWGPEKVNGESVHSYLLNY